MKTIFSIILITIVLNIYAQSDKPEGLESVPEGTVNIQILDGNHSSEDIKVKAFYMSQEITNKEYREFVTYVNENPNHIFKSYKLTRKFIGDSASGNLRDTIVRKMSFVRCSKIINDLIDSTALEKVNPLYKNYFIDSKYDNYPVVGVSYLGASYYCLWKTEMENQKLAQLGKPGGPAYRLPTEDEWAYVASQQLVPGKKKFVTEHNINPVKDGIMNLYSLYHFKSNVSEWTSTYPRTKWSKTLKDSEEIKYFVVKGGSWKSKEDINLRYEIVLTTKAPDIGFRIVRDKE